MSKPKDYPIADCIRTAAPYILAGAQVFQKFTCVHCGSRQTMPDANIWYASGTCEECNGETNIEAQGCNYVLTIGIDPGDIHD